MTPQTWYDYAAATLAREREDSREARGRHDPPPAESIDVTAFGDPPEVIVYPGFCVVCDGPCVYAR